MATVGVKGLKLFYANTWCSLCISCRRRRIDGSDVRTWSRDGAVTSRKQVRWDVSVLSNWTSSCCQGRQQRQRRRKGDQQLRRSGPPLMSIWNSGSDCPYHHQHADRSSVFVDDVVCCPHHHHHHHHRHHDNLAECQQLPQQVSSDAGGLSTPISSLSVQELPLECHLHRSVPQMAF